MTSETQKRWQTERLQTDGGTPIFCRSTSIYLFLIVAIVVECYNIFTNSNKIYRFCSDNRLSGFVVILCFKENQELE